MQSDRAAKSYYWVLGTQSHYMGGECQENTIEIVSTELAEEADYIITETKANEGYKSPKKQRKQRKRLSVGYKQL